MTKGKYLEKALTIFILIFVVVCANIISVPVISRINHIKNNVFNSVILEGGNNDGIHTVEILNGGNNSFEKPTIQDIYSNILNSINKKLKTTEIREQQIVLNAINDDFFKSVNELVNVKEVGAICDGKTDDTEALQSALERISEAGGGGSTCLQESA